MLMTPILVAFLFPFPATAPEAQPGVVRDMHTQEPDAHQSILPDAPPLLSMGPDPGGNTGAPVNSNTTKTGQPTVDSGASPNSSSAGNAAGGAGRGNAQSQGTSGSDTSKRGTSTGNSPSDSTDHSQSGAASLIPSAPSR